MFVWDTAGQERFRQIARMYYRDANGVLICYDITNADSFEACKFWLKDIERHAPQNTIKFLCGLKSDLGSIREVERDDGQKFADENKMQFYEVSSKTGENVNEIFMDIAIKINAQQK